MTTIIYDHKTNQVAIDSREVRGNVICNDNADKIVSSGEYVFFMCGDKSGEKSLVDYVVNGSEFTPGAYAFYNYRGEFFLISDIDGEPFTEKLDCSDYIGSGGVWAMAALDFGCSAKEAVEYAKTRDCKTGGAVRVFGADGQEIHDA